MNILVVSGFLGAGKTTFIKELVSRTDKFPVILENEYGQNNLDSRELQNNGPADLQLLEFMEGCVCCTQKDTFSNTILTISAGLDPEYLIVEPTGVGMLSNILAAIQKVSYENIRLLKPIVVIAPKTFHENMSAYGDICGDQLKYAERIVFSKTEHEDPALISRVMEDIKKVNPQAEIVPEHYTTKDRAWWDTILYSDQEMQNTSVVADETAADMMELSTTNAHFDRPAELIMLLEDILRGEFGQVARAKGVIQVGEEWLRFDAADRQYAIIGEMSEQPKSQCVFIGRQVDKRHLYSRLNCYDSMFDSMAIKTKLPSARPRMR